MEAEKEFEFWKDAILEESSDEDPEEFLMRLTAATPNKANFPHIGGRLVVWQFEGRPYGLKYIRSVRKDKELLNFCEEVIALYRREIEGETVPAELFQALQAKIGKSWDIVGWREHERRMAFARKWAWLGARKWAWLMGGKAWSNAWTWAITATRNRNFAQAAALTRLWAEVRALAKRKLGKHKRIRAIKNYFVHLIQTL